VRLTPGWLIPHRLALAKLELDNPALLEGGRDTAAAFFVVLALLSAEKTPAHAPLFEEHTFAASAGWTVRLTATLAEKAVVVRVIIATIRKVFFIINYTWESTI